jgi:hypothetical protein
MTETALTGGCFCGVVRYRMQSVLDVGYCHCSRCQRIHGAPVVAWCAVPEEDFELQGSPQAFRSSEHGTRYFCSRCGSHLYATDSRPPSPSVGTRLISVYVSTLDRPALVVPQVHQWWADRVPWFDTRDDLLRVEDGQLPHPDKRRGGRSN